VWVVRTQLFTSFERPSLSLKRLAVMVAVLGVSVSAAACTKSVDTAASTPVSTTTVTVTAGEVNPHPSGSSATRSSPSSVAASGLNPATAKSLTTMLSQLPGTAGISIAPVGDDQPGAVFGELQTEVSWSTIKVPLSLAAFRQFGAAAQPDITLAIVNSDNAAAERLWAMLGAPTQAAAAVQRVLKETGDTTTVVQSQQVRSGFTAFGQTEWSLSEQARFAARFPCMPDSAGILELMREVGGSQQWGANSIDDSAVKGGWGPQDTGAGYLVRQLAIVPTGTGEVAVTLATTPDAGKFEDGIAILDTVATWISENLDQLPAGAC
jgi:hypothetical protein